MTTLEFSPSQLRAYESLAKEVLFIGGLGSGKTFYLGCVSFRALLTKNAVCGLFAPTRNTVNTNTLPNIKAAWALMGFHEGEHYVVGRKSPPNWKVPNFGALNQSSIITTRFGSYCVVDGLENFNARRGIEFDEIFIDEFRDAPAKARDVLIGRLRGKAYKELGIKHRIHYASTPPDNVSKITDIIETSPDCELVNCSSFENRENLPAGYIESVLASYDDVKGRREIYGELVSVSTNLFIYAFDRAKHLGFVAPNYNAPLYLSFDFNVNPMTAVLAQHGRDFINVFAEFRLNDSDIYKICNQLRGVIAKFPKTYVTGDAAGRARHANVANGANSYDIILKELNINSRNLDVPKQDPKHADSRVFCNALFAKHPSFTINPECKHLIKDIENVTCNQDGGINKQDATLTHQLDCLRYYLHTYHSTFIKNDRRLFAY